MAHGVEVEWMERHENRAAGRGCTMRLDRLPILWRYFGYLHRDVNFVGITQEGHPVLVVVWN